MNFDEYQKLAKGTAVYPAQFQVIYPVLGLAGEAGEVANNVKKIYRDKNGAVSNEDVRVIAYELGDVLWYIAAMCNDLGLSMDTVASLNLDKLADRKVRGVIGGSGDKR